MFYDIYAVRNYGFLFYGVMIATIMATGNALLFCWCFGFPWIGFLFKKFLRKVHGLDYTYFSPLVLHFSS
jgi:hypothetical protein